MIGSLSSGPIVKHGRRTGAIIGSIISLIGAAMQLWLNFWMLIAGKIVYGISGGILITASALYLSETLPADKVNSYGFAVNFGVTIGITLITCITPAVELTKDNLAYFAIGFIPIIIGIFVLAWWLFVFRNEPLGYCMQNLQKG